MDNNLYSKIKFQYILINWTILFNVLIMVQSKQVFLFIHDYILCSISFFNYSIISNLSQIKIQLNFVCQIVIFNFLQRLNFHQALLSEYLSNLPQLFNLLLLTFKYFKFNKQTRLRNLINYYIIKKKMYSMKVLINELISTQLKLDRNDYQFNAIYLQTISGQNK
ncbi:unnamed protein product (macronuclear) [Paramecium tetraurelia]|uniref:Transmembrane protein n=1 Tax=Paramecium tetraurelia TaxID=5888 RepID=A0CIR6_PARTE|nr:uncharacterized protein GSPATT00007818001 [Paramecium tetraurelia]CAK70683.1 unnamed protein product [Paramecium tetraurelia]|eukprot:XP_001438080.1 hypothetical protein (macronuclear) [Paramecium tetraurelia strain d4-2]